MEQATERVEFSFDRGWYLRFNLLIFLGFCLVMAGFYHLLTGWLKDLLIGVTSPIDLWSFAIMPGVMLLVGMLIFLLTTAAMGRSDNRRLTVLTPYGVEAPPQRVGAPRTMVGWPYVVGVAPLRVGFASLICLRLSNGTQVKITPPFGWRRTDPRLTAALETFRAYARRYGGRTDVPVRSAGGTAVTVFFVVFGLVGLLGWVRLATVPFIPPWAPHAASLPDACDAVGAAGLDRVWPKTGHAEPDSSAWEGSTLVSRQCTVRSSGDGEPRFVSLDVSIETHSSPLASDAKESYEDFLSDRRYETDPVTAVEVGDEAYQTTPSEGEAKVVVWRGNVVVSVRLDGDGADTTQVARRLAAGILKQVRFE